MTAKRLTSSILAAVLIFSGPASTGGGLHLSDIFGVQSAFAWNNDYSSDSYGDSYSQSWNDYKYQNRIQASNYKQQSWWQSTVNSWNNFWSPASIKQPDTSDRTNTFAQAYKPSTLEFQPQTLLPSIRPEQPVTQTQSFTSPATKPIDTPVSANVQSSIASSTAFTKPAVPDYLQSYVPDKLSGDDLHYLSINGDIGQLVPQTYTDKETYKDVPIPPAQRQQAIDYLTKLVQIQMPTYFTDTDNGKALAAKLGITAVSTDQQDYKQFVQIQEHLPAGRQATVQDLGQIQTIAPQTVAKTNPAVIPTGPKVGQRMDAINQQPQPSSGRAEAQQSVFDAAHNFINSHPADKMSQALESFCNDVYGPKQEAPLVIGMAYGTGRGAVDTANDFIEISANVGQGWRNVYNGYKSFEDKLTERVVNNFIPNQSAQTMIGFNKGVYDGLGEAIARDCPAMLFMLPKITKEFAKDPVGFTKKMFDAWGTDVAQAAFGLYRVSKGEVIGYQDAKKVGYDLGKAIGQVIAAKFGAKLIGEAINVSPTLKGAASWVNESPPVQVMAKAANKINDTPLGRAVGAAGEIPKNVGAKTFAQDLSNGMDNVKTAWKGGVPSNKALVPIDAVTGKPVYDLSVKRAGDSATGGESFKGENLTKAEAGYINAVMKTGLDQSTKAAWAKTISDSLDDSLRAWYPKGTNAKGEPFAEYWHDDPAVCKHVQELSGIVGKPITTAQEYVTVCKGIVKDALNNPDSLIFISKYKNWQGQAGVTQATFFTEIKNVQGVLTGKWTKVTVSLQEGEMSGVPVQARQMLDQIPENVEHGQNAGWWTSHNEINIIQKGNGLFVDRVFRLWSQVKNKINYLE